MLRLLYTLKWIFKAFLTFSIASHVLRFIFFIFSFLFFAYRYYHLSSLDGDKRKLLDRLLDGVQQHRYFSFSIVKNQHAISLYAFNYKREEETSSRTPYLIVK